MWRKCVLSHTLLVRIEMDAATVENGIEISQKKKKEEEKEQHYHMSQLFHF